MTRTRAMIAAGVAAAIALIAVVLAVSGGSGTDPQDRATSSTGQSASPGDGAPQTPGSGLPSRDRLPEGSTVDGKKLPVRPKQDLPMAASIAANERFYKRYPMPATKDASDVYKPIPPQVQEDPEAYAKAVIDLFYTRDYAATKRSDLAQAVWHEWAPMDLIWKMGYGEGTPRPAGPAGVKQGWFVSFVYGPSLANREATMPASDQEWQALADAHAKTRPESVRLERRKEFIPSVINPDPSATYYDVQFVLVTVDDSGERRRPIEMVMALGARDDSGHLGVTAVMAK